MECPALKTAVFFRHIEPFMDYRKTVYEVSDQTIRSNRTDLVLFENFIKERKIRAITGPVVMDFQKYLKKERANCGASINRKIFTLRSYGKYFKLAEPEGARHLPFQDVLKIRLGYRDRPHALRIEQVKTLFESFDRTSCLGIRDYALYALMYGLGLRVGEIHSLNLDSLDLDNSTLYVIGKGKTDRGNSTNHGRISGCTLLLSELRDVQSSFPVKKRQPALHQDHGRQLQENPGQIRYLDLV